MHSKPDKTHEDLSRMFKSGIQRLIQLLWRFYKSELYSVLSHTNWALVYWVLRKYKKFIGHKRWAAQ